ncbi:MAG: hypothetical protein APF77_19585 [Clostridia bacterium BRH_c25]|nr:MAG: hypothetical protein APF77_19585 [Clostridia bacterium BRH_c25]
MKHLRKRICKIIDELVNYMLSIEATNINVNIENKADHYIITIKSDYSEEKYKRIEKLMRALTSPKTEEIEEYYWELTGESDTDTELYLVGMMVDKSEISIVDNMLELKLYKCK